MGGHDWPRTWTRWQAKAQADLGEETQASRRKDERAFLQSIQGDQLQGLYVVAISLGLRRGEALGLRWEDVDLDRGLVTVKRALQRVAGTLSIVELKTRASYRSINLPSVTLLALRTGYASLKND